MISSMDDPENLWRKQAACRRVPTDQMFPHEQNKAAWEELKEMCSYCPVITECLAFADKWENTYRGTHGMYGGLTPSERIARRVKAAASCGKPGRKCGVELHRKRNEPPCVECQKWLRRREADEGRWEQARVMIRKGHNEYEITKSVGVHRLTVRRLRSEMAEC